MNLQRPKRTYDYDNVVITYVCEYGNHGRHGAATEPSVFLVNIKCPYCDAPELDIHMCWPCWSKDRMVSCDECMLAVHPQDSWTVKAKWF